MMRDRSPLGRSRLSSCRERRYPAALQTANHRLAAAQRIALAFVRERWPELGWLEPRVTTQIRRPPSPELLKRLGVDDELVLRREGGTEYTFTFARETADDALEAPLVATVTVDDDHQIVKALISK